MATLFNQPDQPPAAVSSVLTGGGAYISGTVTNSGGINVFGGQVTVNNDGSLRLEPARPTATLVGRERELQLVTDLLRDKVRVNLIGMMGVGKSLLADAAAYELRQSFSGGVFKLDLAPDVFPAQVAQWLRKLKRDPATESLDTPTKLDYLLGELARFGSLLVILDNADFNEKVVADFQDMGFSLLLLSRQVLDKNAFAPVELKPFAPDDPHSRELFAHYSRLNLTEANPEDLERLLKFCAGVPLALKLVASLPKHLKDLRDLTDKLQRHIEQVKTSDDKPNAVQTSLLASFELSYQYVVATKNKPNLPTFLNRLSRLPSGFTVAEAAVFALPGEPVKKLFGMFGGKSKPERWYGPPPDLRPSETILTTAADYLEYLAELGLLTPVEVATDSGAVTIFEMHNLIQLCAGYKLARQNYAALTGKEASKEAELTDKQLLQALPQDLKRKEAAFLAQQARQNVRAGLLSRVPVLYARATELYHELGQTVEEAGLLLEKGRYYLSLGDKAATESNLNKASQLYAQLGQTYNEAQAVEGLVQVYTRYDTGKVIGTAERLERLYQTLGDVQAAQRTRLLRAEALLKSNRLAEAETLYDEAAENEQGERDRLKNKAALLERMGNIQQEQGATAAALASLLQAHALAEQLQDTDRLASTSAALADIFQQTGDTDRAEQYSLQSLNARTQTLRYWGYGRAMMLFELGHKYYTRMGFEVTLSLFTEALSIFQYIGYRQAEHRTLHWIGQIYLEQKDYIQTSRFLELALVNYRNSGDLTQEAAVLFLLGRMFFKQKDYQKASYYLNLALTMYRKLNERRGESRVLHEIGQLYLEQKDYKQALQYFELVLAICTKTQNRKDEGITLNYIARVYREQKEYEKAEHFFNLAFKASTDAKDVRGKGLTKREIGITFARQYRLQEALEFLEQAQVILAEVKARDSEAMAWREIEQVYLKLGETEKAEQAMQKAKTLNPELDTDYYNDDDEPELLADVSRDELPPTDATPE